MKTVFKLLMIVSASCYLASATPAAAIDSAQVLGNGAKSSFHCLTLRSKAEYPKRKLAVKDVEVRLITAGCGTGCTIFTATTSSQASLILQEGVTLRQVSKKARTEGGIALLDLRAKKSHIRVRIEACGILTDSLATIMAVEVVFGRVPDEGYYIKGEWRPKFVDRTRVGQKLTKRAAQVE